MINRGVVLILFMAASLFLIAINVQAGFLFIISSVLIAILIVSYAVPIISLRSVRITRVLPAEAFEFEEIPVELAVKNTGWLPRFLLRIEDEFLGVGSHVVSWLPRNSTRTIHHTVRPQRRGIYKSSRLKLSCGAPFGIVHRKKEITAEVDLTVYPVYVDLPSFPVLESQSVPFETLHERRAKGSGYDYLGTREYRAGDSLRMVHWRSSARRGELVVKEYEEEVSSPVNIIISPALTDKSHGDGGKEEDCAVRIAASIARYVSQVGHPLQLFAAQTTGLTYIVRPSFWQVLGWLADLEIDVSRPTGSLIKEALPYLKPRSTLVIISPSTDPEWLDNLPQIQSQRIRPISVLLDEPDAYEEAGSSTTDEMIDELRADRINVYRYKLGDDILECLRKPLSYTKG